MARLVALVLASGVVITGLIALDRSNGREREERLRFDAQAAAIQQEVIDGAGDEIANFRHGVHFIAATHPSSHEQYEAFFDKHLGELASDDPGIVVVEQWLDDALDELVERERALGNTDFEITPLPNPSDHRLIVTRSAQDVSIFGIQVRGLDVEAIRATVLRDDNLAEEDFRLHILDSDNIVATLGGRRSDTRLEETTTVIAARLLDPQDGRLLGYAIRFDLLDTYLQIPQDGLPAGYSARITVDEVEGPIAEQLADGDTVGPDGVISPQVLRSTREATTASLPWRIDVWTAPRPAGLAEERSVWLTGLGTTLLVAAGLAWRDRAGRRLDSARLELARVRTLAATDDLTGLLNRAGLVDAAREIDPAEPAALFFIDLDGFKTVNDEQGHEEGDRLLRRVAEQLLTVFRAEDLVGRHGGDEFVVFTIDAVEPERVAAISRRITEQISRTDSRVTASLGVVTRARGEAIDVKAMLRSADEAMYEAKRAGGDSFSLRV